MALDCNCGEGSVLNPRTNESVSCECICDALETTIFWFEQGFPFPSDLIGEYMFGCPILQGKNFDGATFCCGKYEFVVNAGPTYEFSQFGDINFFTITCVGDECIDTSTTTPEPTTTECYKWWPDPSPPVPSPSFPNLTTINGISLSYNTKPPDILIPLNTQVVTTTTTNIPTTSSTTIPTSIRELKEIECGEYCKKLGF